MLDKDQMQKMMTKGRYVAPAVSGDEDLGPLKLLPGTWMNLPNLEGRGWNMIALPRAPDSDSPLNYRLLVNRYNETLKFSLVDKAVPNRGIRNNGTTTNADQFLVTLDYEQMIAQMGAEDFPESDKAGGANLPIHHEPGLWLHMTNETTNNLDIARLATIPHGDSALALGTSEEITDAPRIPTVNGLPIGVRQDLTSGYLAPYKHFNDNPFKGGITDPNFPGFNPVEPHKLLEAANADVNIVKTTKLVVDTAIETAGILNIPFIVKQANAADMKSTFWIQELAGDDSSDPPKLRLQYLQVVMLDFFPRFDEFPGLIRWPHVSINTMEKVATAPDMEKAAMPAST